jgi:uncharacterized membrane protein YiaA
MAVRGRYQIRLLTILLLVLAVALLVVGIIFFVEPGHHVKRGLLAIALAALSGFGAIFVQRKANA